MTETAARLGEIDGVLDNAAMLTRPMAFVRQETAYCNRPRPVHGRAVFVRTGYALI